MEYFTSKHLFKLDFVDAQELNPSSICWKKSEHPEFSFNWSKVVINGQLSAKSPEDD